MDKRVKESSVTPGAELSARLQPEPWLRGRWFGGMKVAQYSFRLWKAGVSLQHLLLPGIHSSIVIVWKTLKRDTWNCQIIHHSELPDWHPVYIQIAAGHSAPSTTCKGASMWQRHTTESLNSSSALELRHHKKFNTSRSWLPRWEGLVFLGCSSSTAKSTVLRQSPNPLLQAEDMRATSPALAPCPRAVPSVSVPSDIQTSGHGCSNAAGRRLAWWWNWDPGNNCSKKGLITSSQELMWNITSADRLLEDYRQACLLTVKLKRQYISCSDVNMMLSHKTACLDTHTFHSMTQCAQCDTQCDT